MILQYPHSVNHDFPNRPMRTTFFKHESEISVSARNGTPCLAWENLGFFFGMKEGESMANAQPVSLIASPFPKVGEMPVIWGKEKDTRLAENHKAIVNLNSGKLYSIVSKDYRVIRHEEVIKEVEQAISDTIGLSNYEAITAFFNHGGRMRRTYRFKEIGVEVKKGDLINPELHLMNSYDKTWPFIILLGAFRVVCENGLVVSQKLLHLRRRHVYEIEQINVVEEVGTALKRFKQQAQQWKGWTEKRISPRAYSRALDFMTLGIKARKEVEKRISEEAEGFDPDGFPVLTVWGFYNILTWHISHNAVSLNHQVEMEGRLRTAYSQLIR
jgi:hypothetical protein